MSEFFVTEEMASDRIDQLIEAGNAIGVSPTFVITGNYFPGEREDFERYLNDHGIEFFSVEEVVRPNHGHIAEELGFDDFVPPIHLWPWALLVLAIGDQMRVETGEPIRLRNLYRPMSYNERVASSGIKSDHPNACGADFDFKSSELRRQAEALIRDLSDTVPALELSLGMGRRVLHVGVMSPKGSRSWFYKDYPDRRVHLN
ncbi:MAG: hypothetical protein AAF229_04635 [Pseudomonadota bacterium]